MQYRIITKAYVVTEYFVEAKDKTEALALFHDSGANDSRELTDYEVDSEEEVLEVLEPNQAYGEGK